MAVRPIGEVLKPQDLLAGVEPTDVASPSGQTPGGRAGSADGALQHPREGDRWLSEVNLQRLPFATLWDKKTGSSEPIVVEQTFLRDGETVTRRWQVIPGSKYGLPGPSAYATFRALEKILLGRTIARNVPLANPQEFEIQKICSELSLPVQTYNYRRIKDDLRRIKDCVFVDQGFLRQRERAEGRKRVRARRVTAESRFSIIGRLEFRYEERPDGTVARSNAVWLDDLYVRSVNSGYVKLLEWELWKGLRRPVARRLLELFDLRLFATRDAPEIEFDYDELAQLLPVTREKFLSDAKYALRGPLEELRRSGVVVGAGWHVDGSSWSVRLAVAQPYRNRLRKRAQPEFDSRAVELARELRDAKSLPLYQRIVTSVPATYIHMALSETRMAERTGEGTVKNVGAYFTAALSGILERRRLQVPFSRREE